MNLKSQAWGSK